jgi:uncharacterized protein
MISNRERSPGRRRPAELGPLELLVVQPSPFCNINCSYCYLPERNSTRRMSEATLARTFEWAFASGLVDESFTVSWHAGEPTAVPIAFYEKAMDMLRRLTPSGVRVQQSFQTNATLLDQRWCDFIKKHEVRVGVSIDGPELLHDKNRKTKNGKGTHALAMRGIELLQANGIPFSVITVLTYDSLAYPDELFDFYQRLGGITSVGFNMEEIEGMNTSSTLAAHDVDARYRAFMRRFQWLVKRRGRPGRPLLVRELDGAFGAIAHHGRCETKNQQARPGSIVSVDCEGNFTTFSPELLGVRRKEGGDFVLGNVHRDSWQAATSGSKFLELRGEIDAGIDRCRSECPYFAICGGGAPANKYFENGSFASTETLYCRLNKKAVVDVVLESVELTARRQAEAAAACV